MELVENTLVQKLLSLDLPTSDYVVAGSGPLLAHGIKETIGDIDIVARDKAWDVLTTLAPTGEAPSGIGNTVLLFDGEIEAFDVWLPGTCEPNQLIDEAELVQGIPFSPLSRVLDWKQRSDRKKDRADIVRILEYFDGNDD